MSVAEVSALEFLIDAGVSSAIMDIPNNRFEMIDLSINTKDEAPSQSSNQITETKPNASTAPQNGSTTSPLKPHNDIVTDATHSASNAMTIDELKQAIIDFDGLPLKHNAHQIVFADGDIESKIMIIGDAPSSEDERAGIPFQGPNGGLLNKILDSIKISRQQKDGYKSAYITNLLNWRTPGNRTPTDEELDITMPFIKRHIELMKPEILILLGALPAQLLLGKKQGISKLRGQWFDYNGIKTIATYHPSALLQTPLQKRKTWEDMLLIQKELHA